MCIEMRRLLFDQTLRQVALVKEIRARAMTRDLRTRALTLDLLNESLKNVHPVQIEANESAPNRAPISLRRNRRKAA